MSLERDLGAALERHGVRGRRRARILAEVRDHLLESGTETHFGDADELAYSFAVEIATADGRSAARAVALAVAAFLVVLGSISIDVRAHAWLNDAPTAPLAALAVQVAFVAGLVAFLRARRRRLEGLGLVARGNAIALVSLAVGLAAEASAELRHLHPARAGAFELGVTAGLATAAVFAVAAGLAAVRAASRASVTRGATIGGRDDVVNDMLCAAEPLLRHIPQLAPLARRAVDRPWRFCALVAGTAALAISLVGLVQGGDPSPLVGVLEAIAIFAGFGSLGRLLRLR